jgi:CHAT domain-containing protein/tetratricopeptide (TPR) repeat protein
LLRLLAAACAVLAAAGGAPSSHSLADAQEASPRSPTGEVRALAGGVVIREHINTDETRAFELRLSAKQFARVVVGQQGADIRLRVYAPGGALYAEMDSPNGRYGLEEVSVVAPVEGIYKVEVYLDKTLSSGDYEISVEGSRESSAEDELRVTAEHLFHDAQELRLDAAKDQSVEKFGLAIKKYEEARDIWHGLGDRREEGYAISGIGRSYKAQGQLTLALDHLGQALERLSDAGDTSGQAYVLNEMGAAHRDLGDQRRALESYARALELRIGLHDLWGQAQLYNNIGLAYSNIGSQREAIQNFEKALPLWRGLGMRQSEMNTLINAANANAEMGEMDAALAQYEEVLAFCEIEAAKQDSPLKSDAVRLKPFALNGLGLVYDTWADMEKARDNYDQALELFKEGRNAKGEADVLDNLGMSYAFVGDVPQALNKFRDALDIRKRLNQPKGWAMTLSNIGYAYTLLGDNEEALKQLAAALPFSEQSHDRRFEAYTLVRIGMAYVSLNEPRKALEKYENALAIQQGAELEDLRGQAITLDKIGEVLALSGEAAKALEKYGRALGLWDEVSDRQGRALTLYGIARVERQRVNLREAAARVEEAMAIVELLRTKMTSRQLRMTYFAAKQDYYALDVDVRMLLYERTRSEADMEAALSASERGRGRNLLDSLGGALADVRLKAAPQLAELKQPRPLDARGARQLLDPDTLLLEYALGDERSYLWVLTRDRIDAYTLPGRAEIEKTAWQLRESLAAYEGARRGEESLQYMRRRNEATAQLRGQASDLGQMLLGQVASRLGDKRLIVVADGALQYIPFEMLLVTDATQRGQVQSSASAYSPLILKNEVLYEPSASVLALLRSTPRRMGLKTVAVLADPVFDASDERVRVAVGGSSASAKPQPWLKDLSRSLRDVGDASAGTNGFKLERLRYSAEEADIIVAAATRGTAMKATGFTASRATATSQTLKQYNIVHFATHGILNDEHPEFSGLILSMVNEKGEPEDGYLRLRDIYNLELPVDLVVLSACRTGVGKQVRGEGLMSLTRGFMHAGTSKVVASLWKVDDEATAALMKRFYHNLLEKKMPPAAALRQAKLEMMDAREQWRAPYYWAGFVIQGDWK